MGDLAKLRTPFRAGGRVTAGNAAGLNDGAGCVLLTSASKAAELGLPARMRLVDYTFVGVEPETMGWGPVPATEKLFAKTGLSIDDIDVVEMNEAFAVQCIAFLDHFGLPLDSPKVNPYGGAIAMGHPLAMSGARLTQQLAHSFGANPDARYGLVTLCIGLGMGASVLWERI
jgi:acetyl-CoA acyltransferase